ncbi:MAG: hypothetical protein ABIL04_07160 [candidate division WOR-3 bacterium]
MVKMILNEFKKSFPGLKDLFEEMMTHPFFPKTRISLILAKIFFRFIIIAE